MQPCGLQVGTSLAGWIYPQTPKLLQRFVDAQLAETDTPQACNAWCAPIMLVPVVITARGYGDGWLDYCQAPAVHCNGNLGWAAMFKTAGSTGGITN